MMMTKKIAAVVVMLITLTALWADDYVPDQLVVKLSAAGLNRGRFAVPAADRVLAVRYRSQIDNSRWDSRCSLLVIQTNPGCDLASLQESLRKDPLVGDVSFNYIAHIAQQQPNDPLFEYQYALHNTGQVYQPDTGMVGTAGSDIAALAGWQWSTGSADVVIAVLDTGVANDHEDLKNRVIGGYNYVDDNYNPYDDHGHGTFAASIAAAETDNGIGIAGAAWNAKIMPLKVADSQGNAPYLAIAAAIRYAADNGAHVINLSLGGVYPSFMLEDACEYAFMRGCVIAAASGNQAAPVLYPAAYDDFCLAVAASDAHDQVAPWSNFGPQVDVAAPGVWVLGAYFDPADPGKLNGYAWSSGTSFATPYVAGAAALLLGYKPFLTNAQVMKLIKFTADDVNGASLPGIDDYMGYGRINLGTLLGPYHLD